MPVRVKRTPTERLKRIAEIVERIENRYGPDIAKRAKAFSVPADELRAIGRLARKG